MAADDRAGAGGAFTEAELIRTWGSLELAPTYPEDSDPNDRGHWVMEQTVENFICNPLVALGWPRDVRIRLVREVREMRARLAAAAPVLAAHGGGQGDRLMPTMEYYHMLLRELGPLVKDFEREVYTRGLSRAIDAEPLRGMAGELGGVIILTYVMAGRVLVTLTKDGEQVTVAAADKGDPPRMGLHTTTDVEAARAMLAAVIAAWPHDEAAQDRALSANSAIGIG